MPNVRLRIENHYVSSATNGHLILNSLTQQAITIGGDFWINHSGYEAHVKSFKSDVKEKYYTSQLRRCAYCSHELQQSKQTYHLDHIIDKGAYSEFMFETRNLANACTLCNGTKSNKNVLTGTGLAKVSSSLPWQSDDYLILHPHLDEWSDHLEFDEFNRIKSKAGKAKGEFTIDTVGIKKLNLMRISDYFGSKNKVAEKLLRKLNYRRRKISTKLGYIQLLEGLAHELNSASAMRLVEVLKSEVI